MIFRPYHYFETGCAAYLLGCGTLGRCSVVDPHEEAVEGYLAFAASKGMRITHVIDTHVHADHRSGGATLARKAGALYCLHASAEVALPFEPLRDGQEIELGNTRIKVLHTPGTLGASVWWSDLRRGTEPWLTWTGQHCSWARSAGRICPAEPVKTPESCTTASTGSSSPCRTISRSTPGTSPGRLPGGDERQASSTIAFEKRWNPLLSRSREEFVEALCSVPPTPAGMARMLRLNQGRDAEAR
jgi:hypothetical protein